MNGRGARAVALPALVALIALIAAACLPICRYPAPDPLRVPFDDWAGRAESGGDLTVFDATRNAFAQPAPGLTAEERRRFAFGNRLFDTNWIVAPASVESFDGLGPLYDRTACSGCHVRDGRGRAPADETEAPASLSLRLSVPGQDAHGRPNPHPVYGRQLQHAAIPDVEPEADWRVAWDEVASALPDGASRTLRRPRVVIGAAAYGPLGEDTVYGLRVAPPIFGAGLLEAVPVATLKALADPDDADGDGISGRLRRVWSDAAGGEAWGRFGWKAERATLLDQTVDALVEDIGITSRLRREESTTTAQRRRIADARCGGAPEIADAHLDRLLEYQRHLAVPARRDVDDPLVGRGAELFARSGCAGCHLPALRTGDFPAAPRLAEQEIRPFTDLLLHDMGEGLSDGRAVQGASGREWRTPPLWGLGLVRAVNGHTDLLHDGRARDPDEAILWHGGEAQAARDAYARLSATDRAALLRFLDSL